MRPRSEKRLALECGTHPHAQMCGASAWWIKLTAAKTKEERADERPIGDYLGNPFFRRLVSPQ
jgi:hypothetical protein